MLPDSPTMMAPPGAGPQAGSPMGPGAMPEGPIDPAQVEQLVKDVLSQLRDQLADYNLDWPKITAEVFNGSEAPTKSPQSPDLTAPPGII